MAKGLWEGYNEPAVSITAAASFAPNWSVFLEGNYHDLGGQDDYFPGNAAGAQNSFGANTRQTFETLTVGANYRVNFFSPTPVAIDMISARSRRAIRGNNPFGASEQDSGAKRGAYEPRIVDPAWVVM
jgi:hypothetical protein